MNVWLLDCQEREFDGIQQERERQGCDVKSKIDNLVFNARDWLEIKKIESRAVESKRRTNLRE